MPVDIVVENRDQITKTEEERVRDSIREGIRYAVMYIKLKERADKEYKDPEFYPPDVRHSLENIANIGEKNEYSKVGFYVALQYFSNKKKNRVSQKEIEKTLQEISGGNVPSEMIREGLELLEQIKKGIQLKAGIHLAELDFDKMTDKLSPRGAFISILSSEEGEKYLEIIDRLDKLSKQCSEYPISSIFKTVLGFERGDKDLLERIIAGEVPEKYVAKIIDDLLSEAKERLDKVLQGSQVKAEKRSKDRKRRRQEEFFETNDTEGTSSFGGGAIEKVKNRKEDGRKESKYVRRRLALLLLLLMNFFSSVRVTKPKVAGKEDRDQHVTVVQEKRNKVLLKRVDFTQKEKERKTKQNEIEQKLVEAFFLDVPKDLGNVVVFSSAEHKVPQQGGYSIYDDYQRGVSKGYINLKTGEKGKFPVDVVEGRKMVRIVDTQGHPGRLGWLNFVVVARSNWDFHPEDMGQFIVEVDGVKVINGNLGDIINGESYPGLKANGLVVSHNEYHEGGGFAIYLPLEGKDIKVWLERPHWFDVPVYLDNRINRNNVQQFMRIRDTQTETGGLIKKLRKAPWRKIDLVGESFVNEEIGKRTGWEVKDDGILEGFRIKFSNLDKLLSFIDSGQLEVHYADNGFVSKVPFSDLYGKSDSLRDGRQNWRIISHGIHRTGDGYVLYFNLPLELKKNDKLFLDGGVDRVEMSFKKQTILGGRMYLTPITFRTDSWESIQSSIFLNGGYVAAMTSNVFYQVHGGVDGGSVLRWTMPPLEGDIGIFSESYLNYWVLTGYEETIPGAGFHFITTRNGEISPMSGQTPFGGVISHNVLKKREERGLYGKRIPTEEQATLISIPPFFSSLDDPMVISVPFLPKAESNEYDIKASTLALVYAFNPKQIKQEKFDTNKIVRFYRKLLDYEGGDVFYTRKAVSILMEDPVLVTKLDQTNGADLDGEITNWIIEMLKNEGTNSELLAKSIEKFHPRTKIILLGWAEKFKPLWQSKDFQQWFFNLSIRDQEETLYLLVNIPTEEYLKIPWTRLPSNTSVIGALNTIYGYYIGEHTSSYAFNKKQRALLKEVLYNSPDIGKTAQMFEIMSGANILLDFLPEDPSTDDIQRIMSFLDGMINLNNETASYQFIQDVAQRMRQGGLLWHDLTGHSFKDFLIWVDSNVPKVEGESKSEYQQAVDGFIEKFIVLGRLDNYLGTSNWENLKLYDSFNGFDSESSLESIKKFVSKGDKKTRKNKKELVEAMLKLLSSGDEGVFFLNDVAILSEGIYQIYGDDYYQFFAQFNSSPIAEHKGVVALNISRWLSPMSKTMDNITKREIINKALEKLRSNGWQRVNLLSELNYRTLIFEFPQFSEDFKEFYSVNPEVFLDRHAWDLIVNSLMMGDERESVKQIMFKYARYNANPEDLMSLLRDVGVQLSDAKEDIFELLENLRRDDDGARIMRILDFVLFRPESKIPPEQRAELLKFLLEQEQGRGLRESEVITWSTIYRRVVTEYPAQTNRFYSLWNLRNVLVDKGGNRTIIDRLIESVLFTHDPNSTVKILTTLTSSGRVGNDLYEVLYSQAVDAPSFLRKEDFIQVVQLLLGRPTYEGAVKIKKILHLKPPGKLTKNQFVLYIYGSAINTAGLESVSSVSSPLSSTGVRIIDWSIGQSGDEWLDNVFGKRKCNDDPECIRKIKKAFLIWLNKTPLDQLNILQVYKIYDQPVPRLPKNKKGKDMVKKSLSPTKSQFRHPDSLPKGHAPSNRRG